MTLIIGVDPGETTGLCLLRLTNNQIDYRAVGQVTLSCAELTADGWVTELVLSGEKVIWAIERYVIGVRAGKASHSSAGKHTLELIESLSSIAKIEGHKVILRSASEVKPWATNERLRAAGIKGVGGHSLDAARHALFTAVHSGLMPDPLSRSSK